VGSTVGVPGSTAMQNAKGLVVRKRDYVRLAVPEPEILEVIGKESKQKRSDKLTSRQIDTIVTPARRAKRR
jgi:hypothetical protein